MRYGVAAFGSRRSLTLALLLTGGISNGHGPQRLHAIRPVKRTGRIFTSSLRISGRIPGLPALPARLRSTLRIIGEVSAAAPIFAALLLILAFLGFLLLAAVAVIVVLILATLLARLFAATTLIKA